ncbi:MAG TPA: HAD family hydrolase [Thermoplasmata archaeon]
MWVRDIRAVSLSSRAALRRTHPPDAVPLAIHAALESRGAPPSRGAFLASWQREESRRLEARWSDLTEEPLESVLARSFPDQANGIQGVLTAAAESLAASIEWRPDALSALDYLHESGYRVALVDDSSFPLGTSWEQRISPWIDVVISTRETRHAAPHPAVFQELLTRLSLLPKHVLHVGDQLVPDVFGANGVGLRTALLERVPRDPPDPRSIDWLRRVHNLLPDDIHPDVKLRTLEEIPAVLEEFG